MNAPQALRLLLTTLMLLTSVAAHSKDTVLITGANRGIGFEFARQYAELGWTVIATCRSPATAENLNALAASHENVTVEALDVNDHEAIDALAKKYSETAIDVLLNNAGMLGDTGGQNVFGQIDYAVMEQVYRTNTLGPIKMAEAFVEHVAASDQKRSLPLPAEPRRFLVYRYERICAFLPVSMPTD